MPVLFATAKVQIRVEVVKILLWCLQIKDFCLSLQPQSGNDSNPKTVW